MVPHEDVTTAFDLPGVPHRGATSEWCGESWCARARLWARIGAGLQTIVGGNISLFSKLCEQTRQDAFELMIQHASELGANAIIGARYDATEIMHGVTEVLAYGTAVEVEPVTRNEDPFHQSARRQERFPAHLGKRRARRRPGRHRPRHLRPPHGRRRGWLDAGGAAARTAAAEGAIQLYNSDGSQAEISGNGTRCAAALLIRHGYAAGLVRIRTGAGIKTLRLLERRGCVSNSK